MLMFVAVRLLQIREALMLPYKRQKKDDKTWNENTLAWLLHTIAKVGGWYDSKRTGVPEWLVVWKAGQNCKTASTPTE